MAMTDHHRQQREQHQRADHAVEHRLDHHVPVGDRLVENVEHRHVADVGIGARAEPQLVHVRGEPHVDRQHPQLAHHLQDALFRRQRQRHEDEIDARQARELDEIIDRAELRDAADDQRRAIVAAVVEHAADAQVGVRFGLSASISDSAPAAAADDDDAAHQMAGARPAPHQRGQQTPARRAGRTARRVEGRRPDARKAGLEFRKEAIARPTRNSAVQQAAMRASWWMCARKAATL